MDITIYPNKLSGSVSAIPSKSQAHRLLICAAFADVPTTLFCPQTNQDIEATADCLRALGAEITHFEQGYFVTPVRHIPTIATLPCHESGSTLRFLLPVAGALGVDATFVLDGRLPQRPLSPLWEEMERMGCSLSRPTDHTVRCCGKLGGGTYRIDGSVSSQFITGLMLALPLLNEKASLEVTGTIESAPYIKLTEHALSVFGGNQFHSPGEIDVEGDWSNAAFWLGANELDSKIKISGLNFDSCQGDRAVLDILPMLRTGCPTVSAADIPDLVPILSVVAAANKGAVFTDIGRLRHKESDRVAAIIDMLTSLGGKAAATDNVLTVCGTGLSGGVVNSFNDHRIAMSAAIAATVCTEPVTIIGAECVKKSYPRFWAEFARLGGSYEKQLR